MPDPNKQRTNAQTMPDPTKTEEQMLKQCQILQKPEATQGATEGLASPVRLCE